MSDSSLDKDKDVTMSSVLSGRSSSASGHSSSAAGPSSSDTSTSVQGSKIMPLAEVQIENKVESEEDDDDTAVPGSKIQSSSQKGFRKCSHCLTHRDPVNGKCPVRTSFSIIFLFHLSVEVVSPFSEVCFCR